MLPGTDELLPGTDELLTGTDEVLLSVRLRLPAYFGWNRDALADCLRDLAWLPADHYLLAVERSALLLRECPEARETIFRVLETAGRHWARRPDLPGRSFNSLLL
ncbi:barstar family protein [Kitasatospora sp. NPDC048545]|uniref:barstar family protein n=1 Tax=Kitasatospora sp. NPDC048545 TaxID=3157208 RepID=UPI00340FAE8B